MSQVSEWAPGQPAYIVPSWSQPDKEATRQESPTTTAASSPRSLTTASSSPRAVGAAAAGRSPSPLHVRVPAPARVPAAVGAHAAPPYTSEMSARGLPAAHPLRFTEISSKEGPRPVDLHGALSTVGSAGQPPVFLDAGYSRTQVVLKRAKAWYPPPSSSSGLSELPFVLSPIAELIPSEDNPPARQQPQDIVVAYPFCAGGRLGEWASTGYANGDAVRSAEAARIGWCVKAAAEAMINQGINAISAVQPDEIFIDEAGVPRLREPIPGKRNSNLDILKWQSPDEVKGLIEGGDTWGALSYRLGMLLYCLGKCDGVMDPYPGKSSDAVFVDLFREVHGLSDAVRPDLSLYRGPEIIRRMIGACFRIGGQQPPSRNVMAFVLSTVARKAPGEPTVLRNPLEWRMPVPDEPYFLLPTDLDR